MVAIGFEAMTDVTTGADSVAIGYQAGYYNSGSNSVSIGMNAGYYPSPGSNVYMGYRAGNNSRGGSNTAIGNSAIRYLNAGNENVAIGNTAGSYLLGTQTTIVGSQSGRYATGSYNTFMGFKAGYGGTTSAPFSSGENNVAVGTNALTAFTTGFNNTAIGYQAGDAISTGYRNVFVGFDAGTSFATGNTTVGIGNGVLPNATNGISSVVIGNGAFGAQYASYVTVIGDEALTYNHLPGNNMKGTIAIGYRAGYVFRGDSSAEWGRTSMFIGVWSGYNVSTGDNNTIIGTRAGNTLTTGDENLIIGHLCDVASGDNTNNIVIGNNLQATDKDNAVFIGNDTNHIENDFNADATWNYSSDVRQKTEIEDDTLGLDFINNIRPVVYKHKSPSEFPKEWSAYDADDREPMGGDKKIHGLIAQEVKEALDEADVDSFGGWSEGDDGRQRVSREMFVTPLIKAVQELSSENKQLKDKLNDLEIFIKDKLGDK